MQTSRLTFNLALVSIRTILPDKQRRIGGSFWNFINKRYDTCLTFSDKGGPYSSSSKSACNKMSPTAMLLLAEGAEEQESITCVDVLRRGNVRVTIAGVCSSAPVRCRSDTCIVPDKSLCDAKKDGPYDVIILPGGIGGAKILRESPEVGKLLRMQECNNGLIAAICAAPTALKVHNIGKGKSITSYPAMAEELKKDGIYNYRDDVPVVVDGKLITSRGPATAAIFALTILETLQGKEKAQDVAKAMLYDY